MPAFGAGIWHFATYKDRYATDGYGPPGRLLEQLDRTGAVGELSVVDVNWPFAGFDGTLDDVKASLRGQETPADAAQPAIDYGRLWQLDQFLSGRTAPAAQRLVQNALLTSMAGLEDA
jgi:hypothetical protein